MFVRSEDQVVAAGVKIRCPAHRTQVCHGMLIGAIDIHHHDLGCETILAESAPADLAAIGREERATIIARLIGQATNIAAVSLHHVEFHCPSRIDVEQLLLFLSQLVGVARAIGGKDDPLSIG